MARQDINIGSGPNTQDGDNARAWAQKDNANFIELYASANTNWLFLENSFVEKGGGNTNKSVLEAGDAVYFKKITNGTDALTLIGQTYDGGDKQLRASYTQNQTIDI